MKSRKSSIAATKARKGSLLSIVVPVFNEESTVGLFLSAVDPFLVESRELLGRGSKTEIIFVDDGSQDQTLDRIKDQRLKNTTIRVVKLSRNFGKDSALAAGLDHAQGDAIVPMDVDLQDPPEILPKMVAAWLGGAKVVNAVRVDRESDSWFKRNSAEAFYDIYNRISAQPMEPNVGDYRLLDREVVDILKRMPERTRFMKGLFSWLGYNPHNIEYQRQARVAGETKWHFWSLWNFAIDGITGSSTLPLRVWSYFGGLLAVIALMYASWLWIRTLVFGVDTPGYASMMVVILTLGSINMIALGIIGEYVGRIAIEVRQRPLYIVEDDVEVGAGK